MGADLTTVAPVADGLAAAAVRIPPDVVFSLFGALPVTNTLLSAWLTAAVLILGAALTTRWLTLAPRGVQNAWELFCEAWVAIVDRSIGPRGRRYIPLLGASFLFILTANWLGTLPLKHLKIEGPDGLEVALFRPAMSDLNLTLAMAALVILLVEAVEMRAVGPRAYLRSLVLPSPFRALELLARPLSLALRLFGNILAGDILVGIGLLLAPAVVFLVLGLELFVGLVQAVIFVALMLVFLSVALAHEAHAVPPTASAGTPHDAPATPDASPTRATGDVVVRPATSVAARTDALAATT